MPDQSSAIGEGRWVRRYFGSKTPNMHAGYFGTEVYQNDLVSNGIEN